MHPHEIWPYEENHKNVANIKEKYDFKNEDEPKKSYILHHTYQTKLAKSNLPN